MVVLIFAAAFGMLAISSSAYMLPFTIIIEEFCDAVFEALMFWREALFVFPLMRLVHRGQLHPTQK